MCKRLVCLTLCLLMILGCALSVSAQEQKDIFYILTVERFLEFAENCRLDSYSQGLTVQLCRDIDLSGTDFTGIPIFGGIFDGNGHTISGLQLESDGSNAGLFRYLTETAVVRNLHVTGHVTPNGTANTVGGIAGSNAGTIENCSFEGKVAGIDSVGGLVGVNELTGIISQSSVTGIVNGHHFIGGIAGNNNGVIKDCKNHAAINTTIEQNDVDLEDVTLDSIINSESAMTVTDIGGICGTGSGVIRDSSNFGAIGYPQVGFNVGGIVGSWSGYLYRCINHATVDGRKEVGGIVGQLEPAVHMIYEEDTLQTLQQQMDDLSNTAGSIGANIESGSNALKGQSQQMQQQLKDAEDALKVLLPDDDSNDYVPPSEEAIQAAKNALSSSLSDLTGSFGAMVQITQNTMGSVTGNLQAISGQMNEIGTTLGAASENLGGGIRDASDDDTDADLTAKIHNCQNLGRIQGDWNIGGIVGAISLENDLDPESDLQIIGNSSLNFDMELRAVVVSCENQGIVSGKKQNVGGIGGWVSMGLIKQCVNTAAIEGATANYAGGIAGMSNGYIRQCSAKCLVSGETYTGGIAGIGTTVTDCISMIRLGSLGEKTGAIVGDAEKPALRDNYYLPIESDPGAVDGISYAGKAEPLRESKFFALASLPDDFRNVVITFQYDAETSHRRILPYGTVLTSEMIPAIPKSKGQDAFWTGGFRVGEPMIYDTVLTLSYADHVQTLESDLRGYNQLPVLLAQGQFALDATFTATAQEEPGVLAAYALTLSDSTSPVRIRCMLPENISPAQIMLLVQTDNGWQETGFSVNGSYLVFDAPENIQALRMKEIPTDYRPYMLAAGALAVIAVLTIVIVAIARRRKKKKS